MWVDNYPVVLNNFSSSDRLLITHDLLWIRDEIRMGITHNAPEKLASSPGIEQTCLRIQIQCCTYWTFGKQSPRQCHTVFNSGYSERTEIKQCRHWNKESEKKTRTRTQVSVLTVWYANSYTTVPLRHSQAHVNFTLWLKSGSKRHNIKRQPTEHLKQISMS